MVLESLILRNPQLFNIHSYPHLAFTCPLPFGNPARQRKITRDQSTANLTAKCDLFAKTILVNSHHSQMCHVRQTVGYFLIGSTMVS